MLKYLIFDFDGVLADTFLTNAQALVDSGFEENLETAKKFEHDYARTKTNHGRNHTKTEEQMQLLFDQMVTFGQRVNELGFEMFTDFVESISKLTDAKIAIVSSGSQEYVLPAVAKTNLAPTHTLAFEDHYSKEEKVELVCKDWGIDIQEAYYFTDTLVDVYELQNMIAKDKLIGVSWGFCSAEELLQELDSKHILKTPADLERLFD